MHLFLSTANGFYQEHKLLAIWVCSTDTCNHDHVCTHTNTLDNTIGIICTNTESIWCGNCSYTLATGDETKIYSGYII